MVSLGMNNRLLVIFG